MNTKQKVMLVAFLLALALSLTAMRFWDDQGTFSTSTPTVAVVNPYPAPDEAQASTEAPYPAPVETLAPHLTLTPMPRPTLPW